MRNVYEYEYHRWYAKGVIKLARQDWTGALKCFDTSARYLSDLVQDVKGVEKDYVKSWLFDLVGEIKRIEQYIESEQPKKKLAERLAEANEHKTEEKKITASDIPETTFDDIAGLKDVKEAVMYKVIYPRKHPELYNTFKKRTGGGILLYGLPGTGKTLIAEAIAHETNAKFFSIKCSDLGSKWFGETEQNIREIFESARACDNAVIFFDEIEAYATNRREGGVMERSVPEFLTQMQGVGSSEEKNKILVIGATNKPWKLDGAFLRPGRFDEKIYVPLPDEESRKKIIQMRLNGVPRLGKLNIEKFVADSEGFNGADVDYLCEKAKENAIHTEERNETNKIALMIDELKAERSSLPRINKETLRKKVLDFKKVLDGIDFYLKQELLQTLIKEIKINVDTVETIINLHELAGLKTPLTCTIYESIDNIRYPFTLRNMEFDFNRLQLQF